MKCYVLRNKDNKYFVGRDYKAHWKSDEVSKDINKAHIFGHPCMDKGGYDLLAVEVRITSILSVVNDEHRRVVWS